MRLTIERGSDPILQGSYYSLKIGTRVYHYEKLADILYRVAVIFEPPQEEQKPNRLKNGRVVGKPMSTKRTKKFPLGDAILKVLPHCSSPGIVMGEVIRLTKTPRTYSMSIWGAVMGKLAKRGKVKVINQSGIAHYRLAK